ncbi:MAG: hypothetical protein E7475_03755 [Ruminococcaceae bacterium]|nr:hypothetical protein [Oscillospiraceae bacterium]
MKQRSLPTLPFLSFALLLFFLLAFFRADSAQEERGRLQLEETLRLSAMACYAEEGFYPPTLDYLTQHYSVQINEEQYGVFYEIFAENLMPTITVVTLS